MEPSLPTPLPSPSNQLDGAPGDDQQTMLNVANCRVELYHKDKIRRIFIYDDICLLFSGRNFLCIGVSIDAAGVGICCMSAVGSSLLRSQGWRHGLQVILVAPLQYIGIWYMRLEIFAVAADGPLPVTLSEKNLVTQKFSL